VARLSRALDGPRSWTISPSARRRTRSAVARGLSVVRDHHVRLVELVDPRQGLAACRRDQAARGPVGDVDGDAAQGIDGGVAVAVAAETSRALTTGTVGIAGYGAGKIARMGTLSWATTTRMAAPP
jgi:hypothetical protein